MTGHSHSYARPLAAHGWTLTEAKRPGYVRLVGSASSATLDLPEAALLALAEQLAARRYQEERAAYVRRTERPPLATLLGGATVIDPPKAETPWWERGLPSPSDHNATQT